MPVRWVSHASMPRHTYTLEHNHLTQFLVCEFLCQPQACQRGPFRKRTLNLIYICLSLAAPGLVSLVGCEAQNPSHLETEAETIQVPPLPELSSRAQVLLFPFLFATLVPWHALELGILLNC